MAGESISASDAREIAGDWHAGMFTRLYALASTGRPVLYAHTCQACEAHACAREIDDALRDADCASSIAELHALAVWVSEWSGDSSHTC